MEPLMPSEVARLVFGYLKKEKLDEVAEYFLKSSPHLTECYQMFKAKKNFNTRVNGCNLEDLFELFGTLCTMINERVTEACESKSMVDKLQYLLDVNHIRTNADKCVGTILNVVDKCVGDMINIKDIDTHTTRSVETNIKATEVLDIPSFSDMISDNVTKTNEINISNNKNNVNVEKPLTAYPLPYLSPEIQPLNNNASIPNLSKIEDTSLESPKFKINEQTNSTPIKKNYETKNNLQSTLPTSPKNITLNQFYPNQPECQQIPEATSLESMPGLSKEDKPLKDSSVVIDTGELVDTFLNDQSLLEKFADTINKSIEAQKEVDHVQEGNILDPPTLEKALDSTQSDPQIKNVLDEFLVFNVDNSDSNKKTDTDNQENSIKSRLRNAKKKDDAFSKLKKNNANNQKHNSRGNEENIKVNNIVLVHEKNLKTTVFDTCNMLSNQFILQTTDPNVAQSYNIETIEIDSEPEEDYMKQANYRKIFPKISPMVKHSGLEKCILPKRKRRSFEVFGIKSQFKKKNITIQPPVSVESTIEPILIQVPNQSTLEAKSNIKDNIVKLTEVPKILSEVRDVGKNKIDLDTPSNRLMPPKNKSLSTPRRRSTHIRCLDFSTPQPKNNARDQVRSKLFCDTPKKIEKIVEEPSSSPLPKLNADWGSVNGFELIVEKETIKHWDSDIRDMVGAGVLTSDADVRKTRKKKTPRKKIKSVNDKNHSEQQNKSDNVIEIDTTQTDQTNKSNMFENPCDISEENVSNPLLNDQNSLKEIQNELSMPLANPNDTTDKPLACNKPLSSESNSLKILNDEQSLKNQSKFPISFETPDKITELCNEQPTTKTSSPKNSNDQKLLDAPNEFPISLETPDKVTELIPKQSLIKTDSLKQLSPKPSIFSIPVETQDTKKCNEQLPKEFSISFDTPIKITDICNKPPIETDSLKSSCKIQNKYKQFESRFNDQKNNVNPLNTSPATNKLTTSNSKILSEVITLEKDSNFLKTFNNRTYLKPFQSPIKQLENQSNEPAENLKNQSSLNKVETNVPSEFNSPENVIKIQPIKHNLIETPFKCDDSAVDVPETPISKLIREYDPSKLVTPLPSTPVHYEDSLTETPLTKVFRETSYLNRPPISPFPPTPGNSMSVDTLITPPEQECSKSSVNLSSKINSFINAEVKNTVTQPVPTPVNNESTIKKKIVKPKTSKIKKTASTKNKSGLKEKTKQVYESVKVELFGSEISSSSSADESEITKVQPPKKIVIKKPLEEEKTHGFKPIPKRKSFQPTSVAVNDIKNCSLDESSRNRNKLSSIKPIIMQNKESTVNKTKKILNTTQQNKSKKKSSVHFDEPVEQFYFSPTKPVLHTSNNKNISKIENKIVTDTNSNQLVGLSRYLKNPSTLSENKKTKFIESPVKTFKLNNTGTSPGISTNLSNKKVSPNAVTNTTEKLETTKSSKNCARDRDEKSNRIEDSSNQNFSSKNMLNNACLEKTNQNESTNTSHNNSSINNTSCITIEHNDESFQLIKNNYSLIDIEFLKKSKIYEIISEDGAKEMVYLNLSEKFTLLDIPSELHNIQSSSSISSISINNRVLNSTPEIESGELTMSETEVGIPITSTPKDVSEKNIDERQKYRDYRSRDLSNNWRNNYRDNRYNNNYWSNKFRYHDSPTQYNNWSRSKRNYFKREYCDDSVMDKYRYKHKEDKRRNYHDYNRDSDRRGRERLEEPEWFSTGQRMSQKPNKTEDVKKGTKRPADQTDYKTPAKVSKVEHQRLLKNVDVDDFLSVVHGQK